MYVLKPGSCLYALKKRKFLLLAELMEKHLKEQTGLEYLQES